MSSTSDTLSAFVNDAPPGEVHQVSDDIIAVLDGQNNQLVSNLEKDVVEYNLKEFAAVELGTNTRTVISKYNKQNGNDTKFFDAINGKTFEYNHASGKATVTGDYTIDNNAKKLGESISTYQSEHYPSDSAFTVVPLEGDDELAIILVDNKYSPTNYWNGRWKSCYKFNSSTGSISGDISIDVHYYEDGNVRLKTDKKVQSQVTNSTPSVVHVIEKLETELQTELNKSFVGLNSGSFKSLRRQLPVTRSKMDWNKPVSGYKVGHDISATEK